MWPLALALCLGALAGACAAPPAPATSCVPVALAGGDAPLLFCAAAERALGVRRADEPLDGAGAPWRYSYTHAGPAAGRVCLSLAHAAGQHVRVEAGFGADAAVAVNLGADAQAGADVAQCDAPLGARVAACAAPAACFSWTRRSACAPVLGAPADYDARLFLFLSFAFDAPANATPAAERPLQVNLTVLGDACAPRWAAPAPWSLCARAPAPARACARQRDVRCVVAPWGAVEPPRACEARAGPRPLGWANCSRGEPGECACDEADCGGAARGACATPAGVCACAPGRAGPACEFDVGAGARDDARLAQVAALAALAGAACAAAACAAWRRRRPVGAPRPASGDSNATPRASLLDAGQA